MSMTLNEKIKQFLNDRNLSPTRFADEIGVPRPSVSHIMSGRNKPSLEIIQKIIKTYPELGFEWVLEDDVEMPITRSQMADNQRISNSKRTIYQPRELNGKSYSVSNSVESKVDANVFAGFVGGQSSKKVERIVIFYADNTFITFTEGNKTA
jgi:DNA-binding XRE family transcriptional regulator